MIEVGRGPHGRFQKYTHARGVSSLFEAIHAIFESFALCGRGQNFLFDPRRTIACEFVWKICSISDAS
jgi:hypothetical protein